ncbi:hypothetical protein M3D48_06540 [Dermabacter vaginalis]|uniref:hypothetical protein n=1 Tax=Dermabacter vaginalis TaxID=1630135 RepID=UPI0021A52EE6|nr:hypothetical protein [Dermabacter vaginalis]MCT2150276.1 hypothetical protein [Dermabacter vaginalis]
MKRSIHDVGRAKGRVLVRKWLAGILILLGLAGLALGWAGQTVWAPKENHTAKASFNNPGAAVVINPGVLYVGGQKGTVTIKSSGDYFMISAPEGTVKEYLAKSKYTAITGASNWSTLATSTENADQSEGTQGVQNSDLWSDVEEKKSGETFAIEDWSKAELDPKNRQPYRAILLANDSDSSTITEVQITWPSHASNPWTPYAYAVGAVLLIIGLVLLLIAFNSRPERDLELEEVLRDRPVLNEGEGESDASSTPGEASGEEEPSVQEASSQGSRVAEAGVGTGEPAESELTPEADASHESQIAAEPGRALEPEPAPEAEASHEPEPVEARETETEPAAAAVAETAEDSEPAPAVEATAANTPVTVTRPGRRRGTPDDVTDRLKALELDKSETSAGGASVRPGRRRANGSNATTTMTDPIATPIEEER